MSGRPSPPPSSRTAPGSSPLILSSPPPAGVSKDGDSTRNERPRGSLMKIYFLQLLDTGPRPGYMRAHGERERVMT